MLSSLAKVSSIEWLSDDEEAPASATQLLGELEIRVPMAGLIDTAAELQRLDKELAKLEKECQRLNGKLSNDKFVANAPADVVEKEKQKLAAQESARSRLLTQREKIASL